MKMKSVLSLFVVSALVMMSFVPSPYIEFNDLIKLVYEKSITGLDEIKDPRSGKWQLEFTNNDFIYDVKADLEKGVNVFTCEKLTTSLNEAEQYMARYSGRMLKLMPVGKYALNEAQSTEQKHVYEFITKDIQQKAQYPVVEVMVDGDKTKGYLLIKLYEPLSKKNKSMKRNN